jgi:glyoxylase-like metal-dependent hydrolase (beta-lactamase superfamily II)
MNATEVADGVFRLGINDDRRTALESRQRLDELDADTVLFGHGEPWTDGLRNALTVVRERSASPGP